MTKHFLIRSLFFASARTVLLSGCVKDATNVKLPDTPPKLVVGCFISPQDTLIVVTLSRSNPIFGPAHNNSNNLLVADASVIISDGAASVVVPYNSVNERYELPATMLTIASGQTYSLNISTPKGESVSASCTVPPSNLASLTVEFIDTASSTKRINVKWTDIPNETNYYRIFAQTVFADSFANDTAYNEMYSDNSLQNDYDKDGKEMTSKLNGYSYYTGGNGYTKIGYDFYLLNIDAEYYKYQNSLNNYTYGDPFSEPIPLYTNIKGGLGIFGAYQKFYIRYP